MKGIGQAARELEELCRGSVGLEWAQAAGGNASIKVEEEDALLVKASGLRLAEVTAESGFVRLPLGKARALLEDAGYDSLPYGRQQDLSGRQVASWLAPGSPRPSLETGFHALGPRVGLHLHPQWVFPFLCLEDGPARLASLFPASGWVGYRPPGHSLGRLVRGVMAGRPACRLVFLQNHGIMIYADGVAEALDVAKDVVGKCRRAWGRDSAPPAWDPQPAAKAALGKVSEWLGGLLPGGVVRASLNPWVASLAGPAALPWQVLGPDDVIYCGPRVLQAAAQDLDRAALERAFTPSPSKAAVAVRGGGVVLAAAHEKALVYMEELLEANARTRALAQTEPSFKPLSWEESLECLGMEGERYRQAVLEKDGQ